MYLNLDDDKHEWTIEDHLKAARVRADLKREIKVQLFLMAPYYLTGESAKTDRRIAEALVGMSTIVDRGQDYVSQSL